MPPRHLPLFPLNTVLFPGMGLPLHVFEERYRQMIGECLEADRCFGVCLIRYGSEVGGPAEPYLVGTQAEILAVRRLPDGRMNLVAAGRRRFRVVEITRWQPYILGEVAYLADDPATSAAGDLAHQVRDQLVGYMQAQLDL